MTFEGLGEMFEGDFTRSYPIFSMARHLLHLVIEALQVWQILRILDVQEEQQG